MDNSRKPTCLKLKKPPYVCNDCEARPHCTYQRFLYDAAIDQNEYKKTLSLERASIKLSKDEIDNINSVVAPLMIQQHHSVNQVFIEHPECLPISKTTFYRYIDLGLVHVKNIDLQRKVRYRAKKEDSPAKHKLISERKLGRLYANFRDYMDEHPSSNIVEMDTVTVTSGGKGSKCFLTDNGTGFSDVNRAAFSTEIGEILPNLFLPSLTRLGKRVTSTEPSTYTICPSK